jgi:hypothetical protein
MAKLKDLFAGGNQGAVRHGVGFHPRFAHFAEQSHRLRNEGRKEGKKERSKEGRKEGRKVKEGEGR